MTAGNKTLRKPVGVTLLDIADELDDLLWDFKMTGEAESPFRSFRSWSAQEKPKAGILYVLRPDASGFPTDSSPYISCGEMPGNAPHICVSGRGAVEVLDCLSVIFERFRELEADLNWLLGHGGDLNDFCRLAFRFLQNPVYIHDSMFTLLGQSNRVEGMLELVYNEKDGKYFVPLWLIEDFKFSAGYADTLQQHRPAIWGTDQYPHHMRSLYVNIWDEDYYRARILINELHAPLRPSDFRLACILADYALFFLRRDDRGGRHGSRNYEDTAKTLLSGREADPLELRVMLASLGWAETGPFLLVRLQCQDSDLPLSSYSVLRGSLSTAFSGSFVMLFEQRLCMIINLAAAQISPARFRSALAPFLRDSLLYAGASALMDNIRDLAAAADQADFALNWAFRERGERWYVPFEDCALYYLLAHIQTPFPIRMQISPALAILRRYDQVHGSTYYETLRSYLANERSIPRTAAALIIHRTTLLYRLEKITALTRLDLDNETTRLYLTLSYWLSTDN